MCGKIAARERFRPAAAALQERLHAGRDHAAHGAAPAGVERRHRAALGVEQQQRGTIRDPHADGHAPGSRHERVGLEPRTAACTSSPAIVTTPAACTWLVSNSADSS